MTLSPEQEPVVSSETDADAADVAAAPADGPTPDERTFRQLLLNTLVSGVTTARS
jgi:hypothetical protein